MHNPLLQHSSHLRHWKACANFSVCDNRPCFTCPGQKHDTQHRDGEIALSMKEQRTVSFVLPALHRASSLSEAAARHDKTT